jgi:hypothetical protein
MPGAIRRLYAYAQRRILSSHLWVYLAIVDVDVD